MPRAALLFMASLLAVAAEARPAPSTDPVLAHLESAVAWYRSQSALQALASDPADLAFAEPGRSLARQVLGLAFASARAEVALRPAAAPVKPTGRFSPDELGTMLADATSRVAGIQAEVDALHARLDRAPAQERAALQQQLEETQSELELEKARQEAFRALTGFGGDSAEAGGILGAIDELQRALPESRPDAAAVPGVPRPQVAAEVRRAPPSGVLGLGAELFGLSHKLRALRSAVETTAALHSEIGRRRAPLVAEVRATLQEGDQLARESDTAQGEDLRRHADAIRNVTARFRGLSAAAVPLGKELVLLDSARGNLGEWRAAVEVQADLVLRHFLLHAGLLVFAIAAILVASETWRRATFRYVKDLRRRQQSMVLRRVVVAFVVTLMIVVSLVTEVGSIATFAGFITAGLAVALQNVILSVAAYFVLIGRKGVRVGDRVQISGVTGDVMDVGLVRIHLMELRADGLPTGRVVAFSNSVLLQPAANFFRQIPGSNFAWHQIVLTLSAATDYRAAEKRLVGAVEEVYRDYGASIAEQHTEMSRDLALEVEKPGPRSELWLTESGLRMTIRYPAPLQRAAEIDDRVTRALLDALEGEPRLRLAASGSPTLSQVEDPSATSH